MPVSTTLKMPGNVLDNLQVSVISESIRTGECIVQCLEDRGAYCKGDKIQVKKWELVK